jgi:NhaP-type Na+/H+ or K+/H+ antiporter
LQPTIDMLLNLSVFMWLGAVAPWSQFLNNDIVSLPRLLCLGASIILFRRIPVILALYKHIPQVQDIHQAAFMGFFGPIGVSAMFYLYLTLEFLRNGILVDGHVRDDVKQLADALYIVVWFLVICSVVRVSST